MNEVSLRDDGVVQITYHGDQSKEAIDKLLDETLLITRKLSQENMPIRLIADNRDMGKRPPVQAWQRSISILHTEPFVKIAVIGADSGLQELGALILSALGLTDKFRYFSSEFEAENWIKA